MLKGIKMQLLLICDFPWGKKLTHGPTILCIVSFGTFTVMHIDLSQIRKESGLELRDKS